MLKKKAFFLDRDGVINESLVEKNKPKAPLDLSQFRIIEGVKESLQILKQKNYLNIIITNQPDVNLGILSKSTVSEMHKIIYEELAIDDIFVCFHNDKDNCFCRKPKPGLVYEAEKKWGIDTDNSFLIGDRWRDIDLASTLGIKSFFIDYNYNEPKPKNYNHKVSSLKEAVGLLD